MKIYQTNELKNIALTGNAKSGKTTLSEAMLFNGGVIERRGDVESNNTVSDYREIEHENTISVYPTVLYTEHKNNKINIIDAPGADDFVGGVYTALKAADGVIMLINGQNSIEVGTEIQSRIIEKHEKPMVIVINQIDHEKTNFEKVIDGIKQCFGSNSVLAQYPVKTGNGFNEIIDLISMKCFRYKDGSGKAEITEIPADEKEKASILHGELIEKAAEGDESLMELFFENDTLTEEEMQKGIAKGLISRGIFPILCISAKLNYGVDRLMDFIISSMPFPSDMPAVKDIEGNEVICNPKGPASIFIFKTSLEQHIGEINFFKVISGEITEGIDLTNQSTQNKERLSQLYVVAGKNRTKVTKLVAGDIGATVKLKGTKTNHTLNAPNVDWKYPSIEFPLPKYRSAIKTSNEGDEEKLGEALQRIREDDPTIIVEYSKELRQILIYGQGEYHLNILKWHLDNIYKIETSYIPPKIPYRETITKVAQATYRHKKQSGGAGQFGEVHMILEPYREGMPNPSKYKVNGQEINVSVRGKDEYDLDWGGKLVYYNCIVGGSIDARFLPAILKGIMEKIEVGPLTGSYARDICVAVYDGKMHPVDSNEISFKLAGRNAFSNAFKEAGPKIMEPIYDIEVMVPADRMGDVMGDLQGRRAIVQGMSSEKGFEKIKAKVPLAEMNKYSTALSSLTGGRAMYTMKFAEYAQVPGELQNDLLKAYASEEDES
ncbi:MAG: elongation factor G [Bacteroidota bacterium]